MAICSLASAVSQSLALEGTVVQTNSGRMTGTFGGGSGGGGGGGGLGRTNDDGAVAVQPKSPGTPRRRTSPAPTIMERTPPAKCTLPTTIKEHTMRTRDPRSGGAQGVDSRYNARRNGAPGPHAKERGGAGGG